MRRALRKRQHLPAIGEAANNLHSCCELPCEHNMSDVEGTNESASGIARDKVAIDAAGSLQQQE